MPLCASPHFVLRVVLLVLLLSFPVQGVAQRAPPTMAYPAARADTTAGVYHGVRVADPYRWLEDGRSPATAAFLAAQRELTVSVLARLPEREAIRRQLQELRDVPRTSTAGREGGRLFAIRRLPGKAQTVLAVQDADDGPWRIAVDPAEISSDGSVQIGGWSVSPGGRYVAYRRARAGSDSGQTIYVRDLTSGRDLADSLGGMLASGVTWTPADSGFYYARRVGAADSAGVPDGTGLYYHRVGTLQVRDRLLHAWPTPGGSYPPFLQAVVTDDGRFIVVRASGPGGPHALYALDLAGGGRASAAPVVRRLDPGPSSNPAIVGTSGHALFVLTSLDASRGRIVRVDLGEESDASAPAGSPPPWRTVVPESPDQIYEAVLAGGQLIVSYSGEPRLERVSLAGRVLGRIPNPWGGGGALGAFVAARRADAPELFFNVTSDVLPRSAFVHDFRSGRTRIVANPELPVNPADFETKRVTYRSRDGTVVPMMITARRGLRLDGSHPTMLKGYGAYGSSTGPAYFPENVVWLERGGVLAHADVRGGGGEAWHRDGMLERKQNSIDDLIAGAEYLIGAGYTSPARLGVSGSSAGGMLVGAALVQRPDLFAVAIPEAGHFDMLRYHLMSEVARAWIPEFGASDDPVAFQYLRAYSPLHNVQPGICYPATLVIARSQDDRVVPAHSYKFVAALQAAQQAASPCEPPVLLRLGGGSHLYAPATEVLEETADLWAFAADRLGATLRGPARTVPR